MHLDAAPESGGRDPLRTRCGSPKFSDSSFKLDTRTRTQPAGRYSYSIPANPKTLTRQPIASSTSRSTSRRTSARTLPSAPNASGVAADSPGLAEERGLPGVQVEKHIRTREGCEASAAPSRERWRETLEPVLGLVSGDRELRARLARTLVQPGSEYGVDLDALLAEPDDGGLDDLGFAGEFQGDDAEFGSDTGGPDVVDDFVFAAHLPEDGAFDVLAREGEEIADGGFCHGDGRVWRVPSWTDNSIHR